MNHLSATPPPARIVFVYGIEVKDNLSSLQVIKQYLDLEAVDRKAAGQRTFSALST
jgi:hypothetical protein